MSDYTKATNFSVKDTLSTGDPNKIVSGAEIDTEFDNIAVASGTKADKVSGATSGNVAQLDTNGNLVDSGFTASNISTDVITTEGDLIVGNGSGEESRHGIGSNNTVLTSNGTTVGWDFIRTNNIATDAVTSAKLASNVVVQSKIASSAVGRAELKTQSASTSGTTTAGNLLNISLNAYSFFPMIHTNQPGTSVTGHSSDGIGPDAPRFGLYNNANNFSYDVDHRYVAL